jgi:signal peptidase II
LNKKISDYAFLLFISGSIILFDQLTKWMVRANLASEEIWAPWPWLIPYARIVNWHNTGIAFGMFQNMNTVFIILAMLVSIGIVYYFPKVARLDVFLRVALAMQLGGAVGNMIDRIHQGFVTDFISLGSFAVFNVADASISVGVVVLLVGVYIMDSKQKKMKQPPDPDQAGEPEQATEKTE